MRTHRSPMASPSLSDDESRADGRATVKHFSTGRRTTPPFGARRGRRRRRLRPRARRAGGLVRARLHRPRGHRHREAALAHQRRDAGVAGRGRRGSASAGSIVLPTEKTLSRRRLRDRLVPGAAGLPGTPPRRRRSGCRTTDSCSSRPSSRRSTKTWPNCGVRWRITISFGMPSAASVSRSNASGSIVVVRRRREVELHVDQRARQVLDGREALVERRGALDLLDQLLRHRLAGLVVQREAVEHLGRVAASARAAATGTRRSRAPPRCPRQSGYVDRSTTARAARGRTRGTASSASSQLISTGSPGFALHEVRVVRDDRRDRRRRSAPGCGRRSSRRPSACRPGVGIEVPQADVLARRCP